MKSKEYILITRGADAGLLIKENEKVKLECTIENNKMPRINRYAPTANELKEVLFNTFGNDTNINNMSDKITFYVVHREQEIQKQLYGIVKSFNKIEKLIEMIKVAKTIE